MNNPLLILLVAILSAAGLSLALFAVACLAKFLNDMQADARSEEAAAVDGGVILTNKKGDAHARTQNEVTIGESSYESTSRRSVNSGAGEFLKEGAV